MTLVTVVIPHYEREHLPESVRSALDQTHEDVEVIVVDDHSSVPATERLAEVEDERLRVIRHEQNQNGAAARNTGIEAASGEYVAFLDDDDTWEPEKVEEQLERIDGDPEYGACYTKVEYCTPSGCSVVGSEKEGDLRLDSLRMELHGSFGSTLLAETDLLRAVGGFNEELRRYQDGEIAMKLMGETKMACVPEPLATVNGEDGFRDPLVRVEAKEELFDEFSDYIASLPWHQRQYIRSLSDLEMAWTLGACGYTLKGCWYGLKAFARWPLHTPKNIGRAGYYILRGIRR